ncbi:MAG: hypothetical protein KDA61_20535, partial [Planctomycetales bacterium]|nr:hypothetical protein [Planctomycetales bacterium]
LLAVLVAARRYDGALDQSLPLSQLLVVAGLATASAVAVRTLWRWLETERAPGLTSGGPGLDPPFLGTAGLPLRTLAIGWGTSLALALLAVGCCYPGDRNVEWLVWLPLLVCDQFWRQSFFDRLGQVSLQGGESIDLGQLNPAMTGSVGSSQGVALDSDQLSAASRESSDEEVDWELLEALGEDSDAANSGDAAQAGEQIVQQLFRVREADGRESIYGTVLADFQQGQRTATLHVGFCPPLGPAPTVEAEPLDFPWAKVKVAQTLAHGVRLDVRLSEAAEEPFRVPIDFAARPSQDDDDRQAG